EPPFLDFELEAGPVELVAQNREIESGHVVARQVAAFEELEELAGGLAEAGQAGDVPVGDPVHRGRGGGDAGAGVETPDPLLPPAVRMDLDAGDLDDPVEARVRPGRLRVEDHEGSIERQQLFEHPDGHVKPARAPRELPCGGAFTSVDEDPVCRIAADPTRIGPWRG